MLGIILILTLGGIIFVVSITMESAVGALQRRYGVGEHRRMQWVMDEKLHLIAPNEEEHEMPKDKARLRSGGSPLANSVATGQAMEKRDTSHVALLDLDFGQAKGGTSFA
jgi:hypothetical protein